tara:strand:+ start:559 stop:861 length:303 start_codon:yes stop_codon:yes gene_type:complete
MKKFWKIILWVGGFIGAILIFTFRKRKPPTKVYFEDKIEDKIGEVEKIQEKTSKVEAEKAEIQEEIHQTSDKILNTKSKIKDIKSSKDTINDFEKKYRKK